MLSTANFPDIKSLIFLKKISRLLHFQGRLVTATKPAGKAYKIGESNDEIVKGFSVSSQPHCKLKSIEQNVFDLAVNFLRQ